MFRLKKEKAPWFRRTTGPVAALEVWVLGGGTAAEEILLCGEDGIPLPPVQLYAAIRRDVETWFREFFVRPPQPRPLPILPKLRPRWGRCFSGVRRFGYATPGFAFPPFRPPE